MTLRAHLSLTLASTVAVVLLISGADARAATGDLAYAGCLTGERSSGGSGSGACSQITAAAENGSGTAFDSLRSIAISPDGQSAYAAASGDGSVLHLARDPQSGDLSASECISGDLETDGVCELVGEAGPGGRNSGLDFPQAVAVSPDGRHVYLAAEGDDAIARFDRNTADGALTYAGCLSGESESAEACALVPSADLDGTNSGLNRIRDLAVSADGRNVYAIAQNDDALIRLDRNPGTGALTFAGCITGETVGNACVRLDSAAAGGAGSGMNFPHAVEVSPDGRSVYVAAGSDDAVTTFARDASGAVTFAGCISGGAEVAACTRIGAAAALGENSGLNGPRALALSPDGTGVYAATNDDAVARFTRATDGRLTFGGCISGESESAPACSRIPGHAVGGADSGLDALRAIEVSADGESVYVVSEADDSVTQFDRDRGTGALSGAACIGSESRTSVAGCTLVPGAASDGDNTGLNALEGLVLSPDGRDVYAASLGDDSIASFGREAAPAAESPSPSAPAEAGTDTTAPRLELRGDRVQRSRRGPTVTAACDEACSVEVATAGRPKVKGVGAKVAKRIALRPQRAEVAAGTVAQLRLRFAGAKAKRLAREVLRQGGRIGFRLRATATDATGNASSARLAVGLEGGPR